MSPLDASTTVATLALVGNPNSGKSSLFNALTGIRQKVANYPGVTVERFSGWLTTAAGAVRVVDLPGTYSLDPASPDEAIARGAILGEVAEVEGEPPRPPDAVLCVVDATSLRSQLRFVLEVMTLGRPVIVALNMVDLAERDGILIDPARLSAALGGVPVIPTIATRRQGAADLIEKLPGLIESWRGRAAPPVGEPHDLKSLQRQAREIAKAAIVHEGARSAMTRRVDGVLLHPVAGPILLAALLFVMFQAVFAWAEAPMNLIDAGVVALQEMVGSVVTLPWLNSLLVDGVLAGVGSVIIFLPQILILFAFIIMMEQSGYMARAAFMMDRIMAKVGLNGRAFIPLLSSYACAIPGIMATRAIPNEKDRLTTILIAPLMTCAARLPVYTLIIAAFIPNRIVAGFVGLQGLVMFALYVVGIVSGLAVALVLRRTVARGLQTPFMMVMPKYQLPSLRDLALGLWTRGAVFLRRAGTIILVSMIVLWVLASYPAPPPGSEGSAILHSFAGTLGRMLEIVFAPIGFTWEICIALIPGMAAREVAVGALGTVYALQGSEAQIEAGLAATLRNAWSLPTALAFLAWYVFAPQCLATLAVARREMNSWRWAGFMFGYLFALAYLAAGATYWIARSLGL